jgi:branched-chain amino acid aminotransferase
MHPNIMMTKAKVSGNYVSSILAKTESQRAGFDEAIMLGPDGYVAECTGENIFVVPEQDHYTTPRAGILEGITRDSLITWLGTSGIPLSKSPSRATSFTSPTKYSCAEPPPKSAALREIDFRVIGTGKAGPITRAMQQEFDKVVSGKHALLSMAGASTGAEGGDG